MGQKAFKLGGKSSDAGHRPQAAVWPRAGLARGAWGAGSAGGGSPAAGVYWRPLLRAAIDLSWVFRFKFDCIAQSVLFSFFIFPPLAPSLPARGLLPSRPPPTPTVSGGRTVASVGPPPISRRTRRPQQQAIIIAPTPSHPPTPLKCSSWPTRRNTRHMSSATLLKSCLKRSAVEDEAQSTPSKRHSVSINDAVNVMRFVAYYGRPAEVQIAARPLARLHSFDSGCTYVALM